MSLSALHHLQFPCISLHFIIYGCFKTLVHLASFPCHFSVTRQRNTRLVVVSLIQRLLTTLYRCTLACNISTDAHQWWGRTDEEPSSPELRNKKEAELWIRRAYAVLCPHLPGDTYKAKRGEEIKALTDAESDPRVLPFTKSKVVINIYDREGTDLSFVDLPGEFSSRRYCLLCIGAHAYGARTDREPPHRCHQAHRRSDSRVHIAVLDDNPGHSACRWCASYTSVLAPVS